MKKILLSFVALICATVSFAQSQIATLTHGDEIKTFYGYDSFVEAMKAANDGDIISLSSGYFNATDIKKAITLRGAGMVELNNDLGYQKPTIIEGVVDIYLNSSISEHLVIEGLKFTDNIRYIGIVQSPIFKKCNFKTIMDTETGRHYNGTDSLKNAFFINCRVRDGLGLRGQASCINCVIYNPEIYYNYESFQTTQTGNGSKTWQDPNNTFQFSNCVLTNPDGGILYSSFKNCYITNSIYSNYSISDKCVVEYCVSDKENTFSKTAAPSNKVYATTDFFKKDDFKYNFNDDCKFTLTEEAASTYLGNDGTQIGIYGGVMPYDEHTILPKITKCNVANKSTADGKLSVDIQVEAAQ